jgi:putative flavoprotein involved in K+ transport
MSRLLTEAAVDHVVLERGRVAERWRSERWDSFRLLTPNWQTRLPGHRYTGTDPHGFMKREAIVRFFDDYAGSFDAPVDPGVEVMHAAAVAGGWRLWTSRGSYDAANVVVATGHYAVPRRPRSAAQLRASHVSEVFAKDYRSPAALPAGAVVVVGSGPTGQQIADELAVAGRRVFLAVGRHRPLPRRYRGHDVYWWMDRMGALDRTVDTLDNPYAAAAAPSAVLAGEREDLHLRRLARHGVIPVGHLTGVTGRTLHFADDLATSISAADAHTTTLRRQVDAFVDRSGLDVPHEPAYEPELPTWAVSAPTSIRLHEHRVSTIIWAAGYRRDFSWIDAPVFTESGEPVQHRGVTRAPGLMFLGLRFMYRRNSNFIDGVGADAAHLAGRIVGEDAAAPAVA